jgi:predicted lipoprotein
VKRRACVLGALGLGGAALLRGALACGPTEISDQRRELLTSYGEAFLLADYAEFEELCVELAAKTRALAEEPSETTLEEARDAWLAARAPWKRTEVFAFGPYSEEPQRFGPKIDFWPARPETVEETLAGEDELGADSADRLGAPAKGLHALEFLLFEPDTDVVAAFEDDARRGEYAVTIADDLIVQAHALWEAWDPDHGNFLGELTGAGRSSTRYDTLNRALGEVVNRMGYTLENMSAEKLKKPLGDSAGGVPQPDQVESPFSGRSLEDLRDNLRGIELLYFGSEERGLLSLDAYLLARGRHLTESFRARLAAAEAALDAIPEPLEVAIESDPGSVRELMARLGELRRLIQVDVINALSLSVGFNDNDGD